MADDAPAVLLETRLALRPEEAAQALGVSPRTLRELAPQLPRVHLTNRLVVYPVEGLRAWLNERTGDAEAAGETVERLLRDI